MGGRGQISHYGASKRIFDVRTAEFGELGPRLVKRAAGITAEELREITGFDYEESDDVVAMIS